MGRILVVDDDHTVLFMLAEVLNDAGHDVVTTSSADETLNLLVGVEAALVDMHMPGTNGVKLIARIREHNAVLPVILLTADSPAKAHIHARASGAFDVMTKPVDIDELSALVDRALLASRGLTLESGPP
jgi:DNA-binding response OmpR family regulator